MIRVRKAAERGHAKYDWLDTWHTFSFDTYYDPAHMGFRSLRVINEDRVQPGQGFGMHGHRDMEIVTYVLEGALEHRDSMGTGSVIHAGEFQRMSAGTGMQHSEFNPSETEPVHLYQIWLLPAEKGLMPSYEQKTFSEEEKQGTPAAGGLARCPGRIAPDPPGRPNLPLDVGCRSGGQARIAARSPCVAPSPSRIGGTERPNACDERRGCRERRDEACDPGQRTLGSHAL